MTDVFPPSRKSIHAALERVHTESVAYWTMFGTPTFSARIGTAWSPADNVRHLTKSMCAVTRGLQVPRLAVRLLFGTPSQASRSYEQIGVDYRQVLSNGGQAGRFAPSPQGDPVDAEAERARIMTVHATAVDDLRLASMRWREQDLDRYQLPHPLLGKLTVREMLLFTVYHNRHHVDVVRQRMSSAT